MVTEKVRNKRIVWAWIFISLGILGFLASGYYGYLSIGALIVLLIGVHKLRTLDHA